MRSFIGKKLTEDDGSFAGVPALWRSTRGIVKLARRWVQGKVAKKARIRVVSSRLHGCEPGYIFSARSFCMGPVSLYMVSLYMDKTGFS